MLLTSRHDGKILSIEGNKLAMSGSSGTDNLTCNQADDVQVTCDGKICKSSDLKPGMKIWVTAESNESSHAATLIETLEKNPEFAAN